MSIERWFTTTFTVYRQEYTSGKSDYVSQGTFDGHLQMASETDSINLTGSITKLCFLWCPLNSDVRAGDKLDESGDTYLVKEIRELNFGRDSTKHKKIVCEKVDRTYPTS